jgi:inosine triphosphate pyrophosphatase
MLALGPLQMHKLLSGFDDKSAQAVCTFAYCEGPGHEPVLFQGRTDGKLVESRGSTVFGKSEFFLSRGCEYRVLGIELTKARLGFVLRV